MYEIVGKRWPDTAKEKEKFAKICYEVTLNLSPGMPSNVW